MLSILHRLPCLIVMAVSLAGVFATGQRASGQYLEYDEEVVEEHSRSRRDCSSLTAPAVERSKLLARIPTYYKVSGRFHSRIHRGSGYVLMRHLQAKDKWATVALSTRGGFSLAKDAASYRLEKAITASEVASDPQAVMRFVSSSGVSRFGGIVEGGEDSLIPQIDTILNLAMTTDVEQVPLPDGTVRVNYSRTKPVRHSDTKTVGFAVVDPARRNIVLEWNDIETHLARGVPVVTINRKMTYTRPSADFPCDLIETYESKLDVHGSKKPAIEKLLFTDYKIEKIDPEQLRLSYYGLPNELVEDVPDTTRYWFVGGAGLAAVAAAFFARRSLKRRKQ